MFLLVFVVFGLGAHNSSVAFVSSLCGCFNLLISVVLLVMVAWFKVLLSCVYFVLLVCFGVYLFVS